MTTSIDPRYKFSFFDDDTKKQAKYWLINDVLSFEKTIVCSEEIDFHVNESPQLKFSVNTEKEEDSLESCFKEIINATSEKTIPSKKGKVEKKSNEILIRKEIKKFISEPLVDRKCFSSIKRNWFKTPMHSSIIRIFRKNVLRIW